MPWNTESAICVNLFILLFLLWPPFPTSSPPLILATQIDRGWETCWISVVPCLTGVFTLCFCLSGLPQWVSRAYATQPVGTKTSASSSHRHRPHSRAPLLWGERVLSVNISVLLPWHVFFFREFEFCAKWISVDLLGWRWVSRSCFWWGRSAQQQTRINSSSDTYAT